MDGRIDRRTKGKTDEQKNGHTNRLTEKRIVKGSYEGFVFPFEIQSPKKNY